MGRMFWDMIEQPFRNLFLGHQHSAPNAWAQTDPDVISLVKDSIRQDLSDKGSRKICYFRNRH